MSSIDQSMAALPMMRTPMGEPNTMFEAEPTFSTTKRRASLQVPSELGVPLNMDIPQTLVHSPQKGSSPKQRKRLKKSVAT